MQYFTFFVLAIILFASDACTPVPITLPPKEEPQDSLPSLTNEGLNTFGCYIDGELWLAGINSGVLTTSRPISARLDENTGNLAIQFNRVKDTISEFITIFFDRKMQFEPNQSRDTVKRLSYHKDPDRICPGFYRLNDNDDFEFKVNHIDLSSNIISGEFSGELNFAHSNEECIGNIAHIDSARFDLVYQEQ